MSFVQLTFYCELDPQPLLQLLGEETIEDLAALDASLSLGIIDLSQERAQVVQRLNQAGIPVIAWLLLPRDQGYWFNLYNAPQAAERYAAFRRWALEYNLDFARIGIDIEPHFAEMGQLMKKRWRALPGLLRRVFNGKVHRQAHQEYQALVAHMQADGYPVDSYQFPVIDDERKAGSTFLQRTVGLVDIAVDREVWMLYSNFVRPIGAGLIASYAREAQSIGIGSTGGGVDNAFGDFLPLSWDELGRDMRLAWYWCDDLHIFSLEGCVQQGFLKELRSFAWDSPILIPESSLARVDGWRQALRSGLWLAANMSKLLLGALAGFVIWKGLRRFMASR